MDFISDVARLDLKDALKLAIMQSGKTPLRVAQEMGWTLHHSNHVFGLNDYLPSARDFPRLCNVLGNTIIIDCLYGKARTSCEPPTRDVDCPALMVRLNALYARLGKASDKGLKAIEDLRLEPREIRGIIAELHQVIADGLEAVADLSKPCCGTACWVSVTKAHSCVKGFAPTAKRKACSSGRRNRGRSCAAGK